MKRCRSNKWLFPADFETCLISADILNSSAVVRQKTGSPAFLLNEKSLFTDNNNQETSGSFYKAKSHKLHNIWYNVKKGILYIILFAIIRRKETTLMKRKWPFCFTAPHSSIDHDILFFQTSGRITFQDSIH